LLNVIAQQCFNKLVHSRRATTGDNKVLMLNVSVAAAHLSMPRKHCAAVSSKLPTAIDPSDSVQACAKADHTTLSLLAAVVVAAVAAAAAAAALLPVVAALLCSSGDLSAALPLLFKLLLCALLLLVCAGAVAVGSICMLAVSSTLCA
jgi:hypothetical protein